LGLGFWILDLFNHFPLKVIDVGIGDLHLRKGAEFGALIEPCNPAILRGPALAAFKRALSIAVLCEECQLLACESNEPWQWILSSRNGRVPCGNNLFHVS